MKYRARRAFIASFALLLLLGVIHAAAKTNLASMMADRQSQSTGDEAVSAVIARKQRSVLSRKKAIVKKHKHQEKQDEALSSPAQKLPAEPVDSQPSKQVEVVAKQTPPRRSQEPHAVGYTWIKRSGKDGDCKGKNDHARWKAVCKTNKKLVDQAIA